jgi:hypothetical protein
MSAVLSYAAIVIGLLILGALVSLLALLPPIRRWCWRNPAARIVTLCALALASFGISFMLWTRLAAEVSSIYSTLVAIDTFDRPPSTGPTQPDTSRPFVIRELWLRQLVPPSLRRTCYAQEGAICHLADTIMANVPDMWGRRAYLEEIGTALISMISASALAWLWTRARRSPVPGT